MTDTAAAAVANEPRWQDMAGAGSPIGPRKPRKCDAGSTGWGGNPPHPTREPAYLYYGHTPKGNRTPISTLKEWCPGR